MPIKSKAGFGFVFTGCFVLVIMLGLLQSAPAAETNALPESDGKLAEMGAVASRDFLRSYLQIQEQLRDTQLAIEKIRQESAAASASNSIAVEERWRAMEKAIAGERVEQLDGIAHLDRTILIAAGAFAAVAFLVLLLAAFLQWMAVNRLSAAATQLSLAHPAPGGSAEALLPAAPALEQSNLRFLELMGRMEQRLHEMELSVKPFNGLSDSNPASEPDAESSSREPLPPAAPSKTSTINVLLNKSQTLMKLDKAEDALGCLDEILAIAPGHAEALVKKGAALEHLQRLPEAIECYDRAIAEDPSMIMAYLNKAGLFNRMARHSEALACYEQALKPGKTTKTPT